MAPRTTPTHALWLLAAWTILATLWFVSPWFPMQPLAALQRASGGWITVTLLASGLIGLVQLAIVAGPGGQRLRRLGWRASRIPAALLLGLLLWALMQAGTLVAQAGSGSPLQPHPAWAAGLGVALGPLLAQLMGTALMEETVFRGFLWPELARRFGGGRRGAWLGALASQALFALMHLPILWYHGLDTAAQASTLLTLFGVGLVFVLVYATTRNLFVAVAVHALGNAPTLLFEPQGMAPTLWLFAGALAVCTLAFAWRRWRRRPRPALAGNETATA